MSDEEELISIRCGNCSARFGLTRFMYDERKADGQTFYCPNGHPRAYTETETDRLRRDRDRLAQRVSERDDEVKRQREMREATERQLSAAKGRITKIKNRVSKGVCPCCNRQFANLHRHMTTEHPTFTAEAAE
jgi:hypothetical protein